MLWYKPRYVRNNIKLEVVKNDTKKMIVLLPLRNEVIKTFMINNTQTIGI